MTTPERYDDLVLGSGAGGKMIAWALGSEGRRVAVVERRYIGGSCPNIACLPTKNVVHTAKVVSLLRRHLEFGVETGPIHISMPGVHARKQKMVEGLVNLHLDLYRESADELILGEGRFTGPLALDVALPDGGMRSLTASRVFINVGTHATVPNIPGLLDAKPMTHVEALELERLPEHLIVLGGGYVGLEFAQAMRRLGSRVTVIERGAQLASREDADVSDAIRQLFRDEGIEVLLNTAIVGVEGRSGDAVRMQLAGSKSASVIEGTDILVAVGRTPNTYGIGLDRANVALTDTGHVRVTDRLETTAANVWALGECAGSPYFTHVAEDDFRIVHANLNGGNRSRRDRLVPYCIFTDPPLARIGLTESQIRESNTPYRVASLPTATILRTRTTSERRGFLKALVDAASDRVLGFSAFGADAAELMVAVQVAMLAGAPFSLLRDAIFAHPTMAEGLKPLFAQIATRAMDVVPVHTNG